MEAFIFSTLETEQRLPQILRNFINFLMLTLVRLLLEFLKVLASVRFFEFIHQKYNFHFLLPFTVQFFVLMNYHGSVFDFLQFQAVFRIKTEETKMFAFSKIHTQESTVFTDVTNPFHFIIFLMYHQSTLISMHFLAQKHVFLKFLQTLVTESEK